MPLFQYGTTDIEYELKHHDKSEVRISVDWINGVEVTAPSTITHEKLAAVLHKKASWLINKINEIQSIESVPQPKEFVSGEKFQYLGRAYRLKVHKEEGEHSKLSFLQGKFIAIVPKQLSIPEQKGLLYNHFKQWYLIYGQKKVMERVEYYSNKLMVSPSLVQLKEQKMRWGTCTSDGNIYLNWRIVMAPVSIIDYIVVHELAHLIHMNHSKVYWDVVKALLSDYENRKEWLRINGPLLEI